MMNEEFSCSPNAHNNSEKTTDDYYNQAAMAVSGGNSALAIQLYLAAYAHSVNGTENDKALGVAALKEAWNLAYQLRERPLMEYAFEQLRNNLNPEELRSYGERMQDIALDKLEQLGISRKDIEDFSEMIPKELFGGDGPKIVSVKKIMGPGLNLPSSVVVSSGSGSANTGSVGVGDGGVVSVKELHERSLPVLPGVERLNYDSLSGFESAIKEARNMGIGKSADPQFKELLTRLNTFHGLTEPPANSPLFICCDAREDANRFAMATIGEISNACIRMSFEEGPGGSHSLVMSAPAHNELKYSPKTGHFEGSGVVLIEDLDLWQLPPLPDVAEEGIPAILLAQMGRGLKEALDFIHEAIVDSNVEVLVTLQDLDEVEPALLALFGSFALLSLDLPNAGERASLWMSLAQEHPSLQGIDSATVVRLTANMSRCDIVSAVDEAIDETYVKNVEKQLCTPVEESLLLEKIASYQPLDSSEYRALEDAIVGKFRDDIQNIDDLLE